MRNVLLVAVGAVALAGLGDDVTSERFPDADSVVVDEVERVAYNPDGTYESVNEVWTKVLTEKGRRDESTLSLDYSKRYGEAAIEYVGIRDAQGQERTVDVSATTHESTDNSSMGANIYDPLDRRIVCTVPGLKIGDTLHYKTRRKALKPRCVNAWADLSVMEWTSPIIRTTYEVTAPVERPLRSIALRHPLGNVTSNVVRRADGSTVYTFVCTNSPQVFPEPDMPPLYTQVQHLRVSTAQSWPELSRWYWELSAPHLAKTNAAMVAKVEALGRDMRAIFKFVSQEIRYMGLTMEDTSPGYAPHDVNLTFDNRYGVCRDKAGLLVAMLRLAGYNAFPVLINVGAKQDPVVPQPFFNHAVVAVEERPLEYVLMDPTNENTKDLFPAYESDKSYLVCRPEGDVLRLSPTPSPEHNALAIASRGTLAKDGTLFLQSDIAFAGINDTLYRGALARRKPEDRVKLVEKLLKSVSAGAELLSCTVEPADMRDTSKPVHVTLAASFSEMILRGATQDAVQIPFLGKTLGFANFLLQGNTSLETRKYPLVIDATAQVTENLTLDLGASLGAVVKLPSAPESPVSGYAFDCTFALTGRVLTASRALRVSAVEFDPQAYVNLREAIKTTEAAERQKPLFAVDPHADADVRVILDQSETTVFSDCAWVTTNTIVREVLSYDGKRKSAELKFNYNPRIERLEVLSAVVSNRHGRVAQVTERERNEMDCGWAASAPRYPASKMLVVNLPSVEIGSVIAYTVVRTVTNAPAAFYREFLFDAHEPLERRVVRVNDWRREVVAPRRLPNEPNQPRAALWRDAVIVSSNRFACCDLAVGACDPAVVGLEGADMRAIRDWMAKYVKVVGPSLYEVPLADQLTPPEVVFAERYATRLDYVRTLCALLRGAGYEADVVLAADDADEPACVRDRIMRAKPNVRAFNAALCRVRVHEGGFLGFGGTTRTFFIGTENQYAPLGPSPYAGADYFDPQDGTFGLVTVPAPDFADADAETDVIEVRENGAVDIVVTNTFWGSSVGAFRKRYSEILPEDRSRLYQAILGAVAQAASATSDLETDVEGYPATRSFSCYVADYATCADGTITLELPPFETPLPTIAGRARMTPFAVGATDAQRETVIVRFPEGYTKIERLPQAFDFADPTDPTRHGLTARVTTQVRDGRLEVRITRETLPRTYASYPPDLFELVRERNRIARAKSSRTITVRKEK